MIRTILFSLIAVLSFHSLQAQMRTGNEVKLGHEWINFDQQYIKLVVDEDGLYTVSAADLAAQGLPVGQVDISALKLYHFGELVPLYVSGMNSFDQADHITFYGKKNRGEIDRFLYDDPEEDHLNPDYSMFSDESIYFLTWSDEANDRQIVNVINNISSPPAPLSHYMHEEKTVFSDQFWDDRFPVGNSVFTYSSYEEGEGWVSPTRITSEITLPISNIYTEGPAAVAGMRFMSNKIIANQYNFFVNETLIYDTLGIQVETVILSTEVAADELQNEVVLKLDDFNDSDSRHNMASAYIRYPRLLNASGEGFFKFLAPPNTDRTYVEVENFTGTTPVVFDLANDRQIFPTVEGSTLKFALPASSEPMQVIVFAADQPKAVKAMSNRTFENYANDDTEFIIISHPRFLDASPNYVNAYMDYRSSQEGGDYTSNAYNILDLYDMFAYGIKNHPLAIRNFAHFIDTNWPSAQAYFIVGKGIEYNKSRIDKPGLEDFHFVPTYGLPGADNLLFVPEGSEISMLPVGRIPVTNNDQIRIYLDKIKEYDLTARLESDLETTGWQHNVMHLSGGLGATQQSQLLGILNSLGNRLKNNQFGADVTTYSKASTNITELTTAQQILNDLEGGVSVVNFFGHSSATTLDFQVNNPDEWNNKGRYPIFSAMGCSAGKIHDDFVALSSRFNFAEESGTIAFIAASGNEFINPLQTWGSGWYSSISETKYGGKLGESMIESLRFLNASGVSNITKRMLVQQQILSGDPMITLPAFAGPDFVVDYESVALSPEVVTSNTNNIDFSFDVLNIGRNNSDSVHVIVEQQYPNGTKVVVSELDIVVQGFKTTVDVNFDINAAQSLGKNKLLVTVDSENNVDESLVNGGEANNQLKNEFGVLGYELFVFESRMFASHPRQFSIVNEPFPTLIGTSSNAFAKSETYVIEIDTTTKFNSPLHVRNKFRQFGSVVKWQPPIDMIEEVVYYWRVTTDSISPDQGYIWDQSSFVYLPQSTEGWNQSHYYQYLENGFNTLEVRDDRQFEYVQEPIDFRIKNNIYDAQDPPRLFIRGVFQSAYHPWKLKQGFSVAITRAFDLQNWRNTDGVLYNSEDGSGNPRVFSYSTDNEMSRNNLINLLEETVPDSFYVYIWTLLRDEGNGIDLHTEDWAADSTNNGGKNIFNVLEAQGASRVREMESKGTLPYVMIFQKGVGVIDEGIAPDIDGYAYADALFRRNNREGIHTSEIIGPAREWKDLRWQFSDFVPADEEDYVSLKVLAMNSTFTDTIVVADSLTGPFLDLSAIDADSMPFIQLELNSYNRARRAPQLDYWRVNFTPYPDLIVNPTISYEFEKDTLSFGEEMLISTAIENVGSTEMPATILKYTINSEKSGRTTEQIAVPNLQPNESVVLSYTKPVLDLEGDNTLILQVNPEVKPEDQPQNNFGILNFFVLADGINPLLDVTFDGKRIKNEDLVAAKPEIIIRLTDLNEFVALTDPENIDLAISFPSDPGFDPTPVPLTSSEITIIPADVDNGVNELVIEYRPDLFEDGFYELQVQGRDPGGNSAGNVSYRVVFEVNHTNGISNFYNFPNPFSDRTRFMYKITGDEVPAEFSIQVYDAKGEFVREITKEDIGGLRVGSNYTEFAWDATDQYGKRLAQGVYFFKVIAKTADGQDFPKLQTGGSLNRGLFSQEAGRMILIR